MNISLDNILNKIEAKAGLIGGLYGYTAPMIATNPNDPIAGIITEHTQLLTGFKFPTFDSIKWHFEAFARPNLPIPILAYIVGELLGNRAAKDFGENALKGLALGTLVTSMGGGGYVPPNTSPSGGSGGNPFESIYGRN